MKTYLKENSQFITICLIWVVAGAIFNQLALVLVPITLLLLYKNGLEKEIFIGLIFVLTMSDNRLASFNWAADVKNIYIVFFALIVIKNYRSYEHKIKLHLYLLPFIVIASFCILFSPAPSTAVQKTLSYFLLFFSVPNYFTHLHARYGPKFIRDLIFFICIILTLGLLFKITGSAGVSLAGRFRGLLGNPNGLGIYCFLFSVFFTIVLEFFPDLFSKKEKMLIYGVAIFSLVYSGGRSSLIALILFFAFRYFHKLSPLVGFFLLLIVIGSYELITSNIEVIVHAFSLDEYFRVETLKDGSGRLVAWNFAWQQIEKNYFFGRGFSFNEYIFRENYAYLLNMGHQGSSAHNSYLTFWLDTGLVGLLAFISGFLAFIISISRFSISVFPILYSVLFSNQFESWLTASLNPFTILLLTCLSLIYSAGLHKKIAENSSETETITTPSNIVAA